MWPFSRQRNRNYSLPDGILERVNEAKDAVSALQSDWDTLRDYYDPDWQFETIQSMLKQSAPESEGLLNDVVAVNHVYSLTESYVANLLQAVGALYVISKDAQYDDFARSVTRWLQSMYDEMRIPEHLELIYRDAILYGAGLGKTYWDERTNAAAMKPLSPYDFYPDPTVETIDEAEYIAIRKFVSKRVAERLFPNFDEDLAGIAQADHKHDLRTSTAADRMFELWEVYWQFGERYTVYSGEQVLVDGDSPVPNNRYPVHLFHMHRQTGNFWGESLISYVLSIQNSMNLLRTRAGIHAHFAAYPIYGAHGAAPKDMVVSPGEVWKFPEANSSVAAIPPPPFAPEATAMMQTLAQDFDNVSGLHEVTRGIRPEGTTSGVTLDILRQSAQVRLLNPIRVWAYRLADIGQQILEFHQAFSGEPLTASRIVSGEAEVNRVYPSELSAPETNASGELTGQTAPHPYRVVVQAPNDLPLSQAAIADLALRMFQMQAIDQEALLEATNFPYREAVLRRKQQMIEAQMAGQQAALQANGPAPMGPEAPPEAGQGEMPPELMQMLGGA